MNECAVALLILVIVATFSLLYLEYKAHQAVLELDKMVQSLWGDVNKPQEEKDDTGRDD